MPFWKKKQPINQEKLQKLEQLHSAVKEMMSSLQIRHHAANQAGYRVPAHLLLPQIEVDRILQEIEFMEQDG